MNIEGGTMSAGVASAGPSVGGGLSVGGINAGPMVGAPDGEFGPSIGIGSAIINERPVAPAFLENTMPITVSKPLGEIIFNPFKGNELPESSVPSVIPQAEEVVAAAWETPQPVSVMEQAVVPSGTRQAEQIAAKAWEVSLASQGETLEAQERNATGYNESLPRSVVTEVSVPDIIQAQRTQTALETAGMVDLSMKVASFIQPEVKSVVQPALVVSAPLAKEQQFEQLVEEEKEVQVEEGVDEASEINDEEETEELRLRHVEDTQVSEQRRREIRQAIRVAKAEVESDSTEAEKEGIWEIEGWRVAKFLPSEHEDIRSQIVKKQGPDGSLSETYETIAARLFSTEAQALKEIDAIISEKPPVKRDKDGHPVKNEDIARVFKHHLVKRPAYQEVVLRMIKKRKVE